MDNKIFKSIMKYMLESFYTSWGGEIVIDSIDARKLVEDVKYDINSGTVGLISSETYSDLEEPLPVEVFINLNTSWILRAVDDEIEEVLKF